MAYHLNFLNVRINFIKLQQVLFEAAPSGGGIVTDLQLQTLPDGQLVQVNPG